MKLIQGKILIFMEILLLFLIVYGVMLIYVDEWAVFH